MLTGRRIKLCEWPDNRCGWRSDRRRTLHLLHQGKVVIVKREYCVAVYGFDVSNESIKADDRKFSPYESVTLCMSDHLGYSQGGVVQKSLPLLAHRHQLTGIYEISPAGTRGKEAAGLEQDTIICSIHK